MLTERLALKVHASGWEFNQILCLARGGMRPGDILSRVFDKPLAMAVTRAEIPQTTVRLAYMLSPGTGYILLSEFSRSTGREMAEAQE